MLRTQLEICPAHAGVIPSVDMAIPIEANLPRARGGDP